MSAATRRAAIGAILAAPLATGPAMAEPAASSDLLRLVMTYEATHAALVTEIEREEAAETWAVRRPSDALSKDCGRARAAIAFYPAANLSDVMLKVRTFMVSADLAEDTAELRHTIERNEGHAYDEDVARAVVLDLMRLGEAVPCA